METGKPVPLTVRVEQPARSVVVLCVGGEIDAHTAPQLRDAIARHAPAGQRLVIDLNDVSFLDTAGLAVLVWAGKRGADTRLVCASRLALRVLDVAGLRDHFRVSASLDEALNGRPG